MPSSPTGPGRTPHTAFAEREGGVRPTALCALLAGIQPSARATGLSAEVLVHMKATARVHGLEWLIAPVRPNLKSSHPLTPIERYVKWCRPDGRMFDSWLRTHEPLGAAWRASPREATSSGGPWSSETSGPASCLPSWGQYVLAGALEPPRIDRERDEGMLIEPNV